jgi:hypothetical protein
MSSNVPGGDPPMSDEQEAVVRLAEYATLRAEILKRFEVHFQVVSLTIIAAGTLLFAALQSPDRRVGAVLVLSYPFLAFLLGSAWGHSDRRIAQLGAYIRERIEPEFGKDAHGQPRMGWESHHARSHVTPHLYRFAISWVFAGTELFLIAVAVAVLRVDPFGALDATLGSTPPRLKDPVLDILFVFAVLCAAATPYATRRGSRITQAR